MRIRILVLLCALSCASASHAQSNISEASLELSALPVAISVAAPVAVLSGAAALTVVSVTAVVDGTVWVLERASDGLRISVRFAGNVIVASGTVCALSVIASGTIVSTAGHAIAFIPNEAGRSLLYNERVTR